MKNTILHADDDEDIMLFFNRKVGLPLSELKLSYKWLSSAKDAVLTIREKAAELLVVVTDMNLQRTADGNLIAREALQNLIPTIVLSDAHRVVERDVKERALAVCSKDSESYGEIGKAIRLLHNINEINQAVDHQEAGKSVDSTLRLRFLAEEINPNLLSRLKLVLKIYLKGNDTPEIHEEAVRLAFEIYSSGSEKLIRMLERGYRHNPDLSKILRCMSTSANVPCDASSEE